MATPDPSNRKRWWRAERGAQRVRGAELLPAMDRPCSGLGTPRGPERVVAGPAHGGLCSGLLADVSHSELVPERVPLDHHTRHRNPGGESRNAYRQADERIAPGSTSTPANAIDVVQPMRNRRFAVDAANPEMCFEDQAGAAARTPRMKERSAALARPQLWADRSPLDRSVCFQLVPSSQAVRPCWLPNERAQGDVRPPR